MHGVIEQDAHCSIAITAVSNASELLKVGVHQGGDDGHIHDICDRIWENPPYGTACAIVLQAFFIAYGDNIAKVIFLQLWLDKP